MYTLATVDNSWLTCCTKRTNILSYWLLESKSFKTMRAALTVSTLKGSAMKVLFSHVAKDAKTFSVFDALST